MFYASAFWAVKAAEVCLSVMDEHLNIKYFIQSDFCRCSAGLNMF